MVPENRISQQTDIVPPRDDGFSELFASLAGEWQLIREISDGARFEGTGRFFTVSESSYRLEETGQLLLQDNRTLSAAREWQWISTGDCNLEIRYPVAHGGARYHLVNLAFATNSTEKYWHGSASHDCGKDVYVGSYRLAPDCLDISQDIQGPQKNLMVKSRFARR